MDHQSARPNESQPIRLCSVVVGSAVVGFLIYWAISDSGDGWWNLWSASLFVGGAELLGFFTDRLVRRSQHKQPRR